MSHVIVLFDFIEEKHAEGAPLREALLDAGIIRLRPVLSTVGATVLGLFPLAAHGGPLWEPLCYVQIGGLTIATVSTLVLVPVIYAVFVLDLKLVKWDAPEPSAATPAKAFEHFRPIAAEVPTADLPVFTGQPLVMRTNVLTALDVVAPHLPVAVSALREPGSRRSSSCQRS